MPMRSMRVHLNLSKEIASDEDEDQNANKSRKQSRKQMGPRHILLDITRECQERIQHCHIPGLTLSQHSIAPPSELRNYPICKFSAPQPIYVSSAPSNFKDIGLNRPIAFDAWRKRLMRLKTAYDKAQNARGMNSLVEENIYNWNLYELAEHINLNPDPYFDGTYDYYFTGGNLALLPMVTSLMPTPLVAHFSSSKLHAVRVSKFLPFDSSPVLCPVYRQEYESESNEIFEVRSQNCYHVNRGNVFAIRQKDKITLQQLLMGEPPDSSDDSDSESDEEKNAIKTKDSVDDNNDELEPGEIKVSKLMEFRTNNVPFMSFAQAASDATTFAISNANQTVRVYDIGFDTPKLKSTFKLSTDNKLDCNILREWQGEVIIYANSQYVCPMDLRSTPKQWEENVVYTDSEDYIKCDMISALSTSSNVHHLYVATSHKLHCLDVRYMSSYLDGKCSIVTFTHQLRQAPLFISTYAQDEVEFVALASAQPGDVCVCEVSAAKHLRSVDPVPNESNYTAYTLPYQPPTLDEALQSARSATKCLHPEGNIKTRIRKCTTGLTFYDLDKWRGQRPKQQHASAYLMTANSIGDVYAQTVTQRSSEKDTETRTDRHTDDLMVEYVEQVRKKTKTPLQCTSVHNMLELREIFGTERYSLPKTDYKPISGRSLKRCEGWRKNMSTLRRYQDYLAEYMLDIWDVEDANDHGIRIHFDRHIEKEEKGKFVDDWLVKQIPLPEAIERTVTLDHQAGNRTRVAKLKEPAVNSAQQAVSFKEKEICVHDVTEIPNSYELSGIEMLDVIELPPRVSMVDDFEIDQIKTESVNELSYQHDNTFETNSNVMVSLPVDVSQHYSPIINDTFNFSQRPHSTVEKKRKGRKGF